MYVLFAYVVHNGNVFRVACSTAGVLEAYHAAEFFAGQANVSKCLRLCGYATATFDINRGHKSMDWSTDAGFASET